LSEDRFGELLTLMGNYSGTIDEVAYFTGYTHPPLPLAVVEERAAMLEDRIARLRKVVPSVGINHLATMGHIDENLPNSLSEPWQRLMAIDGATIAGCFCPSDVRLYDYVRKSYIALANAKPDFIWIDDDVRFEGHGSGSAYLTCFCNHCLGIFGEETGQEWTRESLKAALNGGTLEDRLALRRMWLEHNRGKIDRLLTVIRDAVDSVDGSIKLGLMCADIYYSGAAYDRWTASMAGKQKVDVKWRPGTGFFTDEDLSWMICKAHIVGGLAAFMPEEVTDIQSEIENFPYNRFKKSATTNMLEVALYIGAGATGAALNICGIAPDPVDEHIPTFDKIKNSRAFFDSEVAAFGRSMSEGIWTAANKDSNASLKADGDWLDSGWGANVTSVKELSEMGIPTSYSRDAASVTLLKGDSCLAFSRDELIGILKGGVMMDGQALRRLNEMGLSEYTGYDIAEVRNVDNIERFTDDKINGRYAGWHRDTRPSFWAEPAYVLKPLAAGCRALSEVIDFTDTSFGPTSGVFENSFGGRVAVMGYSPWSIAQTLAKTEQLKTLMRWLSRDTLPAYVASFNKAPLWCRKSSDGKRSMLLLNAFLDRAENLQLKVLGQMQSLKLTRTDGRTETLTAAGRDGGYSVFQIPEIGPWEVVLLAEES
jgi:hypothetical protein